jgi:5-methylcytosine-specific restriction endonuclease McrA
MTGRTPELWVGATPDAAIPARVKVRVFERYHGVCQLSGIKIMPGMAWDVDHRKPLSMGGRHAEDNLQPVLRDKHREKTAAEAKPRAKADRIRARHLGLKEPSRGFRKPPGAKFDWSRGRYVRDGE